MYTTCVSNYLYTSVSAWANYATTKGVGGGISAGSALFGLQNCNNTFNTELDNLGDQFDSCITNYCS